MAAVAPLPVLVTRPEPGATATAARLRRMGFGPVVAPLLAVDTLSVTLPSAEGLAAIVVASQHAVPPLPERLRSLTLFAVGDATAEAARRRGFAEVHSAEGDAAALAALVAQSGLAGGSSLLLAAGLGQGHRLSALLEQAGFAVARREVYAARPAEVVPEAARAMISAHQDGRVLLFSRETALCLCRLVEGTDLVAGFSTLDLAAISHPVAEAAGGLPWRSIRVAMTPMETAVLALLHD